jgi:hypothetical protein
MLTEAWRLARKSLIKPERQLRQDSKSFALVNFPFFAFSGVAFYSSCNYTHKSSTLRQAEEEESVTELRISSRF